MVVYIILAKEQSQGKTNGGWGIMLRKKSLVQVVFIQVWHGDNSTKFADELRRLLCGSDALGVPSHVSVVPMDELPKGCDGPNDFIVTVTTLSRNNKAITTVLNKTRRSLMMTEQMVTIFVRPTGVVVKKANT